MSVKLGAAEDVVECNRVDNMFKKNLALNIIKKTIQLEKVRFR